MKEMNNATCSICGNPYHMCVSCKDMMSMSPWKKYTDTIDCFKVYQVIKGYSTKVYTKEEFKSKLKNIDLSNLENYREHIKALIKDALKDDEVVKPIVEPISVSRKKVYKVDHEFVKADANMSELDKAIEVE